MVVELGGEEVEIKRDYVDVRISSKEGFDVAMENNLFVILDTTLTDELKSEGYAREFVSKIQQIRKNSGFDVLDNIEVSYRPTEAIKSAIKEHEDFVKDEVLAVNIIENDNLQGETVDLNGEEVVIELKKM